MSKARQFILEGADAKDWLMSQPEQAYYEVVFGVPGDEITRVVRGPQGLTNRQVRTLLGIEEMLANVHVHRMHPDFIVDVVRPPTEQEMAAYEAGLIDEGIIEPGE